MRALLLILCASGAGACAAAMPSVWYMAFPALGLLFYTLWYHTQNWQQAAGFGYLFGAATIGASIWWTWDTLPLSWLPIESAVMQWLAVGLWWGYIVVVLALVPALYAVLIWRYRTALPALALPLTTATAWGIQEYAREWFFYVVTLGDQSLAGAHFSITALGYALTEHHYTLQFADTVGIYGLETALALMAAAGAYGVRALLHRNTHHALYAGALIATTLAIPAVTTPPAAPPNAGTLAVALIATDVSIDSIADPADTYQQLLTRIAKRDTLPDVIILPEGNGLLAQFPNTTERTDALAELFGGRDVLIISSTYLESPSSQTTYSTLSYESTTRGTLAHYEKLFLMGQGEYAPYIAAPLFRLLNSDAVDSHLASLGRSLSRGENLVALPYRGGATIGALLCSEILSPWLYTELVRDHDATILVNLSHTSWFRSSPTLFAKMRQMARTHAVQHRAYFLQASNGFPALVIAPDGAIIATTPIGETRIVDVTIPLLSL